MNQIKIRFTDEVIIKGKGSIKALCEKAVKENISLDRASLDGASLNWASLNWASLNWASLDGASLNRASLNGVKIEFHSFQNPKKLNRTTSFPCMFRSRSFGNCEGRRRDAQPPMGPRWCWGAPGTGPRVKG